MTVTSYHQAVPTVDVRTSLAGGTIRAAVRIEHPRLAPVIVAASDEDHARCLASQLRRLIDISADAGRAEAERTYAAALATAQLDLLSARRQLAGCTEED